MFSKEFYKFLVVDCQSYHVYSTFPWDFCPARDTVTTSPALGHLTKLLGRFSEL